MNFDDSIKSVLRNSFNFKGRATRSEFWWFLLFAIICGWIFNQVWPKLGSVYILLVLFPIAAVMIRRMHDVGKSGWHLLLFFGPQILLNGFGLYRIYISSNEGIGTNLGMAREHPLLWQLYKILFVIGFVWVFILLVIKSQARDNKWGPNPETGILENELKEFGENISNE